ncbi:MAG: hypothetical protein ACRDAX_02915 [Propionibacteriaceae bacterium]
MKRFTGVLYLFFIFGSSFAGDALIDNEIIDDEVTAWNFEALNITLVACKNYYSQLVEKNTLNSNASFPLAIQIKEAMDELKKIIEAEELEKTESVTEKSDKDSKESSKEIVTEKYQNKTQELETMKEPQNYTKLYEEFSNMVKNLPLSIVTLIWSSKTHLFNKYHEGEYLYVVYDNEVDDDRRSVYTWLPGGRDPVGIWEFSTDDDGKTFFIKNAEYNESFYAGDDSLAYDKSRRNVYTWGKETSDEKRWIVEIQGENEIMLKSKDRGEYFYAGYSSYVEGKRRKVFNWRETSPCDDTCVWIVSPEKGSIVSRLED